MPAVHPLAELVRTEFVDVVPDGRIVDHPGGHEVQFDIAGNRCAELCSVQRSNLRRIGDRSVFLLPELEVPLTVKRYLFLGRGSDADGLQKCQNRR